MVSMKIFVHISIVFRIPKFYSAAEKLRLVRINEIKQNLSWPEITSNIWLFIPFPQEILNEQFSAEHVKYKEVVIFNGHSEDWIFQSFPEEL